MASILVGNPYRMYFENKLKLVFNCYCKGIHPSPSSPCRTQMGGNLSW
jgi:hypothetical protein